MNVQVAAVDTVTLTVTFPAEAREIQQALVRMTDDPGYNLVGAGLVQTGDQREPETKGVRLVFKRVP